MRLSGMKNATEFDPGFWSETALAKINLSLRITGRRDDGYHDLQSVVAFADIGDLLEFTPNAEPGLHIQGPFANALMDACNGDVHQNIVLKAAQKLTNQLTGQLILEKNLPIASGIGGGSADAAACLRLLRRVLRLEDAVINWAHLALSLGADVPVCLRGETTLVTGIGDQLTPLSGLYGWPLLLVNPGVALSTPAVFAARQGPFSAPDSMVIPHDHAAQKGWLAGLKNDLTAAAQSILPIIGELLADLRHDKNIFAAGMSGSGATCFALGNDAGLFTGLAEQLRRTHPNAWVATGQLIGLSVPV